MISQTLQKHKGQVRHVEPNKEYYYFVTSAACMHSYTALVMPNHRLPSIQFILVLKGGS